MENKQYKATTFAILAAALYGISSPVSKLLLKEIPPTLMASFLYLGAGSGIAIVQFIKHKKFKEKTEARLTKHELPYIIGMVVLDIAAPIFLMYGLTMTSAANASLLNNFEIVATALIALLIFKESISKRLWGAIALITVSSIILSVEDLSSFSFSFGSIFVLIACTCWGLENNCTRKLSVKDPLEIVVIKGFGSGIGSLLIAFILGEQINNIPYIISALLLGFFAYGLGISFYIYAQRELGAARTSAYYAIAPFIGVGLSLIIFREIPTFSFVIALVIMIIGTYFASTEKHKHNHSHNVITHEHSHSHDEGHHIHTHDKTIIGTHNHIHSHEEYMHSHKHTQDIHHSHAH
ncbi:DMT family transporter [Clostridium sp. CF012]|uniref:DMT family transporter n=1 Tax=Clostridium sp. CF012 TaxID=2843319 RepID=UPI001C0AF1AA|nr:DMT family transporter [Clostridium sp. CF012]MBU3146338.1 EamA family transporter [Clostridium sp. CF012]